VCLTADCAVVDLQLITGRERSLRRPAQVPRCLWCAWINVVANRREHRPFGFLLMLLLLIVLGLIAGCSAPDREASYGSTGSEPEESTTKESATNEPRKSTEKESARNKPEQSTTKENARNEPEQSTSKKVSQLSLEDAVGQMLVVGVGGTEPDYYIEKMLRERNIGGIILHDYNMQSKEQTQAMVSELQKLSIKTSLCIPLIVAVDQEGGRVSSAPWVTYHPPAAAVGQSGDPAQAQRIAKEIGRQLDAAGVNTDLAPVVDTGFGAAIGNRSFGTDPHLVSEMGAAAVRGFEAAGLISTAKHFPNHGAAKVDSHTSLPVVDHDMQTVLSYDLPPFKRAVEAGVPMVMVGHLLYPAIDPERPASLSPKAIKLLRQEVGFDGVIITDDLAMEGAKQGGTVAQAAVKAVSAGADMLIISSPQEQVDAYAAVVRGVKQGRISQDQINDSVDRILKLKQQYLLRNSCGP
jgi:beta-N-acetylhexosaminidase